MRISLAGGYTDLPAYYQTGYGIVCNTTIDRYVTVAVRKNAGDGIHLQYWKTEHVRSVDDLEHGIIREALKKVGIHKGVALTITADIALGPAGTGLGSSSSTAVGVLNALYALKGESATPERLARDACDIEINRLKNPIGKQDQYAAAFGGFNATRFHGDGSVLVTPLKCRLGTQTELCDRLMLFDTHIDRYASRVLSRQQPELNGNNPYLDRLRDLSETMKRCLQGDDYRSVGKLLHSGWQYKRRLSHHVSNPLIDRYYLKARKAGATGGKISGAGGGGFLLLYCERPFQEAVRRALSDLEETRFRFESTGSRITRYPNPKPATHHLTHGGISRPVGTGVPLSMLLEHGIDTASPEAL